MQQLDKVIFTVFRDIDVNSYRTLVADYFPAPVADEADEADSDDVEEVPEDAVAP